MAVTAHVEELRRKHANLSEMVEKAQRAPGTSDQELTDLKKKKLRLKEEIARLTN